MEEDPRFLGGSYTSFSYHPQLTTELHPKEKPPRRRRGIHLRKKSNVERLIRDDITSNLKQISLLSDFWAVAVFGTALKKKLLWFFSLDRCLCICETRGEFMCFRPAALTIHLLGARCRFVAGICFAVFAG